jgi:hypothetical protein
MSLCNYGCGQEAKFVLKNGKNCCSPNWSKCPELRRKNSIGLKECYKSGNRITTSDFSEEAKYKMGSSNRGKNKFNCEHLKRQGETFKERLKQGIIIASFKGRNHKKETKEKQRNYILDLIKKEYSIDDISPRKGRSETILLDKQEKIDNCIIDRKFKILNYFPDGYCHETNTIYEVYESYHYLNDNIKKRDEIRQKEIQEVLNCKFVIIQDL